MVDAPAAESPLREYLRAVFRTEQVVGGNANVAVDDVVVRAGFGLDLDARRFARYDEHAVRAHHEQDVGDAPCAREPLLTVDDPLVAVACGVGLEEVGIGTALGFGHRIGRPQFLAEHRLEPALLLLVGAVRREHLHVSGVGRGGAEHRGRGAVATEDFVDETELELAEAGSPEVLVEKQRPQTLVLDLVLEIFDERLDLGVLRAHGVGEHQVEGLDLFAAELLHPVELLLELGISREVPGHVVSFAGVAPTAGDQDAPCGRANANAWPRVGRLVELGEHLADDLGRGVGRKRIAALGFRDLLGKVLH